MHKNHKIGGKKTKKITTMAKLLVGTSVLLTLTFVLIIFIFLAQETSFMKNTNTTSSSSGRLVNIDTKYNRHGSFSKIGLLRDNETGKMKPLLSRQISRDRHQYFTSENHDGFMLNVPLFDQSGRSCTNGAGCNSLFDGDRLRGIDGSKYQVIQF